MNFLAAVNRVLRTNAVIKGDDDEIETFNDTQHNATLQLAIIAIQDELNDLIADRLISYEKGSGTITLATGTRTYSLESDFIRFFDVAFFYDTTTNTLIYEYPGGEESLRREIYDYKTQSGAPNYWYWENATTKKVAFFQVPDVSVNGNTLTYDYEKDVSVSESTDTLPFQTEIEAQAFCSLASRRFKALLEELPDPLAFILQDPTYITAKSRLVALMNPRNYSRNYGVCYR